MPDNIQVRLAGTPACSTITIIQDLIDPTVSYEEVRRWADLSAIKQIQEAHETSTVYTWALFVTTYRTDGIPTVLYYDYLSHESTILPVAFSDQLGVLYDVTIVPLTYA